MGGVMQPMPMQGLRAELRHSRGPQGLGGGAGRLGVKGLSCSCGISCAEGAVECSYNKNHKNLGVGLGKNRPPQAGSDARAQLPAGICTPNWSGEKVKWGSRPPDWVCFSHCLLEVRKPPPGGLPSSAVAP